MIFAKRFLSYVRLTLTVADKPTLFALPPSTPLHILQERITQSYGQPAQILKLGVLNGALTQFQIEPNQNILSLLQCNELRIKIGKFNVPYKYHVKSFEQRLASDVQLSVVQAFKLSFVKKSSGGKVAATSVNEIINDCFKNGNFKRLLRQKELQTVKVVIQKNQVINSLKEQFQMRRQEAARAPLRRISFINKISYAHFAGLFAITYGVYGWDVGQPLSYLSSILFQLVGMYLMFFNRPTNRQDYLSAELQKVSGSIQLRQVQQRVVTVMDRRTNIQSPE